MSMRHKLSKGILQMKFMTKSKEKVEKEEDDAEGRALYSNEITEKMLHGTSNYIIEPSYVSCENLIHGRVSYGGINPEIERLIEIEKYGVDYKNAEQEKIENAKMRTDVSDVDMAQFYSSVVHTMEKKYQGVKRLGDKRKEKHQKPMLPLNMRRMQKPKDE